MEETTEIIKDLERRLDQLERYGASGGISVSGTIEDGDLLEYDSATSAWLPKNPMEVSIFGAM